MCRELLGNCWQASCSFERSWPRSRAQTRTANNGTCRLDRVDLSATVEAREWAWSRCHTSRILETRFPNGQPNQGYRHRRLLHVQSHPKAASWHPTVRLRRHLPSLRNRKRHQLALHQAASSRRGLRQECSTTPSWRTQAVSSKRRMLPLPLETTSLTHWVSQCLKRSQSPYQSKLK